MREVEPSPTGVALRALTSLQRGVFLFKVFAWTTFAVVGPTAALVTRNFVGGAVLGGIGVLIGVFLFRDGAWTFRGRTLLRVLLTAQGVAVGAYSGYRLVTPPPGWRHESQASRPALVLDVSGRVHGVELGGGGAVLLRDPASARWTRQSFPGQYALTLAVDEPSGATLVGEDRRPTLWVFDPRDPSPTEPWRPLTVPGEVVAIARAKTGFFVATRGPLARVDATTWHVTRVPSIDRASTVCAARDHVLVVRGEAGERAGRAWESRDGGASFHDEPTFRGAGRICALDGTGWAWVAEGGIFSGDLSVRPPGGAFTSVEPPLSRMESLVVNAADGREAWLAGWGGGVFRTRDAGVTWQCLGLDGFEVESIAVDFTRHVVFASTGSGVYARAFDAQ